jgi:hypothetical protein
MSKFERKMTDVAYIGLTRFCGIRGLKRVFAAPVPATQKERNNAMPSRPQVEHMQRTPIISLSEVCGN